MTRVMRNTMSRMTVNACFVGALIMSMAVHSASAQEILNVGDPLPVLKGHFLSGRDVELPVSLSRRIALVAIGFTYKSRFPVEAWADWYRTAIGSRPDVTFFEVPMIGGISTLGRWLIDRGMRRGTPTELHEQVITVYHGAGDWKRRVSYSPEHEDDAYLIVVDRGGIVRWLHHGAFDQARADDVRRLLTSLADRSPSVADHPLTNRRSKL